MKKKKEEIHAKEGTGEKMVRGRLAGERRPRKSADKTANKAVESRVYIEVNMKTSNKHYVLIIGT